jgi:hypothetical protein
MNSWWIDSVRRAIALTAVAGAAMSLLACTSMGNGSGTVSPDHMPVEFAWSSKDGGGSGTMSATVGSGATFGGPFVQVIDTVRTDSTEPPYAAYSTRYSGMVVADLKGPDSQQLRCRFHLNVPTAGMHGGGQGECQFTGGHTIDAVFPRS